MKSLSILNNPQLPDNPEATGDLKSPIKNELSELRHLLLQPEQERLQELNERLEDPGLHAQDVSRILPEALLLSAKQGNKLSNSLSSTVEDIVRVSIKRNIHTFSDILFPVIGPAIRKAISESLKQMLQSLNQTLDRSFSWQGLKWRLESLRSGKPFAEIVMLHSMLYRVEQIFLIHAETGLLLQHVAAEAEAFQDADLVSGMLTAIQDFVNDSFDVAAGNELNTIQMGDFTIWLVQGPKAVIAGAIRGTAPEDLRLTFNSALEMIHMELADELDKFDGDASLMKPAQHHLQACLQSCAKEKPHKFSPLMIVLLLAAVSGLGLVLFWSIREQLQWHDYLQQLEAEPGIIVTEATKQDDGYRIYGLRDPLAREPAEIFSGHAIEPGRVVHLFQPYQALSKDLVLLRAQRILTPPKTVTLSFDKDVLKAHGTAPFSWISDTRLLARALPGVLKFDDSKLTTALDLSPFNAPDTITLILNDSLLTASGSAPYIWIIAARDLALQIPGIERYDDSSIIIEPDFASLSPPDSASLNFKNGLLSASGSAPHAWIIATRKKALQLPGINQYNDDNLQNEELTQWQSLKLQLEQVVMLFGVDAAASWQENTQNDLTIPARIKQLLQLSQTLDRPVRILIIGHSDSSGRPQRNMELSRNRAEYMHYYLVSQGISAEHLIISGVGANEPVQDEDSKEGKKMNRSVTFKVHLTDNR